MIHKFLSNQIEEAAALLREGKLIAFPTETVYGLGAVIDDEQAIQTVFAAKGRPADNPLIVHISNLSQVALLAKDLPEDFTLLAKHFWPGSLTIVVRKQPNVSALISGGLDSVALRFPSHPIARELIEKVGRPLIAPSANRSGRPSATSAQDVIEDLGDRIAGVIIDEGECAGIESTVISLLDPNEPQILRPGVIEKEQIEKVLGKKLSYATTNTHHSPGMRYRHYAPSASVHCVSSWEEIELQKPSIIISREKPPFPLPETTTHFFLSRKNIYAILREADRRGCEEIFVLCDEQVREDAALWDRLQRATHGGEECIKLSSAYFASEVPCCTE